MYCMKCGKEIPEYSNFCLYCGAKLKEVVEENSYPQTDDEKRYEQYFRDYVLPKIKSPATAKWPKFDERNMIKEVGTFSKYTVIETYIDSQNSYGATIRTGIRIKIDNYKSWSYGGVAFRNPNDAFFGVFLP